MSNDTQGSVQTYRLVWPSGHSEAVLVEEALIPYADADGNIQISGLSETLPRTVAADLLGVSETILAVIQQDGELISDVGGRFNTTDVLTCREMRLWARQAALWSMAQYT